MLAGFLWFDARDQGEEDGGEQDKQRQGQGQKEEKESKVRYFIKEIGFINGCVCLLALFALNVMFRSRI